MCRTPSTLDDGTQVACRECWQCRRARVDDLVGRCIAEMRTSVASHAVTLTYGRDGEKGSISYGEAEHERAVLLTYSDIQKLFKLLRYHKYPFRYLVTGEYGSRKGRAHWHCLFFWKERVPPGIVLGENWRFERYNEDGEAVGEFWPHGHTFWSPPAYETFRYNVKYVLKEMGQGAGESQARKGQSTGTPLGSEYFKQLAWRHAEQGIAPQDALYSFPEAVKRNGEPIMFRLSGAALRDYVREFASAWAELQGGHMPNSEFIERELDRQTPFVPDLVSVPYRRMNRPDEIACDELSRLIGMPVTPDQLRIDEKNRSYYWEGPDGRRWDWRKDGAKGVWEWQDVKLARVVRENSRRWSDAVAAARQTSEPWRIKPGSKPLPQRPPKKSRFGPRNRSLGTMRSKASPRASKK